MNISNVNIALQLATIRGGALSALIGTGSEEQAANFAEILGAAGNSLSPDGRNLGLRDPEAAYSMMTKINRWEVDFKAQYAELDAMSSALEHMEAAGGALVDIDAGDADTAIIERLQAFIDEYNAWEDRFDDTVAQGGVLDEIQAAEVAMRALELSIGDRFHGAAEGVRGLDDLGIRIDPVTKQASLDVDQLKATLASNRDGAMAAIDAFSAHFARSADLLNAEDNFMVHALDNRSRAIQYIADNQAAWQQEFGTGKAAEPAGATAQALAAYNAAFRLA
ncbi:MAG: hypothetical protein RBS28_12770 [Rhodocyclaceae bacterium]|jgi:hypothetical protein|nr:hypothetical protein [Rhodocyclaceae bacterium]